MNKIVNVLLVHGAWANGSSWQKVIPLLQAHGILVTAVHLPLTSLKDDVATVGRALDLMDEPVLLVGHSYGGIVITEAGTNPKVARLVYVAAFAPDIGESLGSLSATVPATSLGAEIRADAAGFLKLTEKGVADCLGHDLSGQEKQILFAVQSPTAANCFGGTVSNRAWKQKPAWYVIAAHDRAVAPVLQEVMAKKINAQTVSIPSSHLPIVSHPEKIADFIFEACQ